MSAFVLVFCYFKLHTSSTSPSYSPAVIARWGIDIREQGASVSVLVVTLLTRDAWIGFGISRVCLRVLQNCPLLVLFLRKQSFCHRE